MGRSRRLNLPGAPFHLTTRLQGRRPLFAGIEEEVLEDVARTLRQFPVELLAYAVMPNHLHLVVIQGPDPLAAFMQPLVRRLALRVQRRFGSEGHVFERRYRSQACLTVEHLRRSLVYVNLNPVRAGMCADASAYRWTSHRLFCGGDTDCDIRDVLGLESALMLFSRRRNASLRARRRAYLEYVAWRVEVDERQRQADRALDDWIDKPHSDYGDDYWWQRFSGPVALFRPELAAAPLESIARAVIGAEFPGMHLDSLRGGGRLPAVVRARRMTIARAHLAGYRNHQIARYLMISQTTVSRVVCALREDILSDNGGKPMAVGDEAQAGFAVPLLANGPALA